ncbi:MAG: hypothetical protein ACFB21_10995 [Opitutales bacterium]
MSVREQVLEIVDRLPPEASLSDVAREIELVEGIQDGLAQAERQEGIDAEQLRRNLRSWARR